jgi:diaminohydroxyphosphoribosylaminopyrimidine deaminase/5-amino-6-(5-phosphoribosylamino)uracil reductase
MLDIRDRVRPAGRAPLLQASIATMPGFMASQYHEQHRSALHAVARPALNFFAKMDQNEQRYMLMALKLARRSDRRASSSPLIGAVAVTGGRAIGHGLASTESEVCAAVMALTEAGEAASRCTLYTNAEPCSDIQDGGNQLSRLIEMHPQRVVIGSSLTRLTGPARPADGLTDDRGLRGGTIERLKHSGIVVDTELCEEECRELNEVYYKYAETGLPFVTLKFAASLDGRIATSTGHSQWISGEGSLRLAHRLRREHDAVLVGIGTVLADDPSLTVRLVKGPNPLRVVVDGRLRIPASARLISDAEAHTLIVTSGAADPARIEELERLGAEVLVLPAADAYLASSDNGGQSPSRSVDLSALLRVLGQRRIASVLVEGGSAIITSLLAQRTADRLVAAIAPKIIGKGLPAIGELGIQTLNDAITFSSVKIRKLGQDIIFDGRFDL